MREEESDVDSNERFMRDFVGPDDNRSSESSERVGNTNNTVGSREEATHQLQSLARAQVEFRPSASANEQTAHVQAVTYIDDETRVHRPDIVLQNNNAYLGASGSSDNVRIPHRAPTVPPPPVERRIPPLAMQDPAFQARQREMYRLYQTGAIRQESSHESDDSTDSGEYTIGDGSPASSGLHHSSRNSSRAGQRSGSSISSRSAVAAAVVIAAASSASVAEGSEIVVWPSVSPNLDENWTVSGWVCGFAVIVAWCCGLLTAWCCFRHRVEVKIIWNSVSQHLVSPQAIKGVTKLLRWQEEDDAHIKVPVST